MADTTPKSYSADPTLYLYTSLTAGSSHIITATSRLETILKANKIHFEALDVATDEKARMLWGRRSKGKKLPGLVRYGSIVGDLREVEEWNEYGELKQQLGGPPTTAPTPTASATTTPSKLPAAPLPIPGLPPLGRSELPVTSSPSKETGEDISTRANDVPQVAETPLTMAMRQAGAEAARKAGEIKGSKATTRLLAKDQAATTLPIPPIDIKMARAVEEPGASADVTAAKIPEKLAEEGAKRTSVGKIANESEKRTATDQAAECDAPAELEHVGLSKEAAALEARRISSMTKSRSPLSEETILTPHVESKDPMTEAKPMTHRGSSVSLASKEEILAIERRNAIPEEVEESETASTAGVGASDDAELAATEGVKPQAEDAKDPKAAGTSVGD